MAWTAVVHIHPSISLLTNIRIIYSIVLAFDDDSEGLYLMQRLLIIDQNAPYRQFIIAAFRFRICDSFNMIKPENAAPFSARYQREQNPAIKLRGSFFLLDIAEHPLGEQAPTYSPSTILEA